MKNIFLILLSVGLTININGQEQIQTELGPKSDFIYNDGNIGIGTTSPLEKLHIENGALQFLNYEDIDNVDILKIGENIGTTNEFSLQGLFEGTGAAGNAIKFRSAWNDNNLVIRGDGNIGIGTTSPLEKLHIENGALQFLNYEDIDNVDILKIGENIDTTNEFSLQGLFEGAGATGNAIKFRSVWNDNNLVIRADGNIGIGTTSPLEKLHIENGALQFLNYGDIDNVDILKIGENIGTTNEFSLQGLFEGTGAAGNAIKFRSAWNDNNLVIRGDGNIGIGTSEPDSELSVNGTIHTKEVKVDLIGWSDFVFYDDYKLPTLTAVENHIKEKGHLKNIPSAKEVEENGILLGEMDSKLLQKIEELTLYTIEQEKKITIQDEKIQNLEALNKKFTDLQTRLEKLEKSN